MSLPLALINNLSEALPIDDLGITLPAGPGTVFDVTGLFLPDELRQSDSLIEFVVLSGAVTISGTAGPLTTVQAQRFFNGSQQSEQIFTVDGFDLRSMQANAILGGPNVVVTSGVDQDGLTTFTVETGPDVLTDAIVGAGNASVVSGTNIVTISGIPEASPSRHVYVDKNNTAPTPDGTFHNAFTTVADALASISPTINDSFVVIVRPGFYVESPFTLTSGTVMRSSGLVIGPTFLSTVSPSSNFITMEGRTSLEGFFINGPISGSAAAVKINALDSFAGVKEVSLAASPIGIQTSKGTAIIRDIFTRSSGNYGDLIQVDSGATAEVRDVLTFSGSTLGSILKVIDSGSLLNAINVAGSHPGVGRAATASGSTLAATLLEAEGAAIGVEIGDTAKVILFSPRFATTVLPIKVNDLTSTIQLFGGQADRNKFVFPVGYVNDLLMFQDSTPQDVGFVITGELAVGRPEQGSESVFGQGDSYTRGMVILTTDNTATSGTEGGNITDVTVSGTVFEDGNTITFQGTSANHTILLGSELGNIEGTVKHFGFKVNVKQGAVGPTSRSFLTEHWTEAEGWHESHSMATHSNEYFSYAEDHFLRPNSSEQIRYDVVTQDHWDRKTINGKNLYWSRIRIIDDLTTLPTFDQIKLHPSRFEANADGFNEYFGRARFKQTLSAIGNIFGETGGVVDSTITVGSGSIPTGWGHKIKNSHLKNSGDAIYTQFVLPRGIDTSSGLIFSLIYTSSFSGVTASGTVLFSMSPLEVVGTLVADPAGGISPIPRPSSATETLVGIPAQTFSIAADLTDETRAYRVTSKIFDISQHYEGDLIFFRFELDDDTPQNQDITIVALELSGVRWAHGEKII